MVPPLRSDNPGQYVINIAKYLICKNTITKRQQHRFELRALSLWETVSI